MSRSEVQSRPTFDEAKALVPEWDNRIKVSASGIAHQLGIAAAPLTVFFQSVVQMAYEKAEISDPALFLKGCNLHDLIQRVFGMIPPNLTGANFDKINADFQQAALGCVRELQKAIDEETITVPGHPTYSIAPLRARPATIADADINARIAAWPETIRTEYSDSIQFCSDHLTDPAKAHDFSEFTPEELHHYLRFLEAGVLVDSKELMNLSYLPARIHHITANIVQYKLAAEGRFKLPIALNQYERNLATAYNVEDLPDFMKISQEAGDNYAAVTSKLLFHITNGNETLSEMEGRGVAGSMKVIEMVHGPSEGYRRVALRRLVHKKFETPQQRISATALYLTAKLKPEESPKKTYQQEFDSLVKMHVEIFLHTYYTRDQETMSPEAIAELADAVTITASLQFSNQFNINQSSAGQAFAAEWETERLKLIQAVEASLMEKLGPKWQRPAKSIEQEKTETSWLKVLRRIPIIFEYLRSITTEFGIDHVQKAHYTAELIWQKDGENIANMPLARSLLMTLSLTYLSKTLVAQLKKTGLPETLKQIVAAADSPYEISEGISYVYVTQKAKDVKILLDEFYGWIDRHPESIEAYAKNYRHVPKRLGQKDIVIMGDGATDYHFWRTLLDPMRKGANPECTQALFNILAAPDAATFMNTCVIAADLLEQEKCKGPLTEKFFDLLFSTTADFENPNRFAAFRNISGRLSGTSRKIFIEKLHEKYWLLPKGAISGEVQKKFIVLLGEDAAQFVEYQKTKAKAAQRNVTRLEKVAIQSKVEAPLKLLQGLSGLLLSLPGHDIQALIDGILEHRTIQMSYDGHTVTLDNVDSPLKNILLKARVKKARTKEVAANSLACEIRLEFEKDLMVYCRLAADGSLIIRILDEKNQEKELITRATAQVHQISENLFDEINYVILKVLEIIYKRKEELDIPQDPGDVPPPTSPGPEDPGAVEEPPATNQPDSPDNQPVLTTATALTDERTEGRMVIDLTDREKAIQRKKAKEAKIKITSNRGKAYAAFVALNRGTALPEVPPTEVAELILHRREQIKGEYFYTPIDNPGEVYAQIRAGMLDPSEVFIRSGRAFGQPLPYIKYRRHVGNDPDAPVYHVVRKRVRSDEALYRRDLFMEMEKGEAIEVGAREKFLFFDVADRPDQPLNRQIFERVQSGQDIPAILRKVEEQIDHQLARVRRKVRSKYLEGTKPDPFKYAEIMQQAEQKGHLKYDAAQKIAKEIAAKTKSVEESGLTILQLPQLFAFDQTFNQGQFESLHDLLKLA